MKVRDLIKKIPSGIFIAITESIIVVGVLNVVFGSIDYWDTWTIEEIIGVFGIAVVGLMGVFIIGYFWLEIIKGIES
jgi:hypothetical protein